MVVATSNVLDWIVSTMLNTLIEFLAFSCMKPNNRCLSLLTTRRFGTNPRHTFGHLLGDHHLAGDFEGAKFLDPKVDLLMPE